MNMPPADSLASIFAKAAGINKVSLKTCQQKMSNKDNDDKNDFNCDDNDNNQPAAATTLLQQCKSRQQ